MKLSNNKLLAFFLVALMGGIGFAQASTITVSVRYVIPVDTSFGLAMLSNNATFTTSGAVNQVMLFNTSVTGVAEKVNISTQASGGSTVQTAAVAGARLRRDGNTPLNFTLALDAIPTGTCGALGVVTKLGWNSTDYENSCNTTSSPTAGKLAQPTSGCVNVTTTESRIANISASSGTFDVWLWAQFNSCSAGFDDTQVLSFISNQTSA